jgi:hypothetical protein
VEVFPPFRPRGSTGIAGGTVGGSPAMTASAIAQQATLLAMGPIESSVVDSGVTPSRGMRFWVGLKLIRSRGLADQKRQEA